MNFDKMTGVVRSTRMILSAGACALALAGCGSAAEPATLESLGLAVSADIQQGASLELAVPVLAGTTVSVASAPTGIAAVIKESGDGLLLTIDVRPDTPSGSYNLGLTVTREGQEHLVGWPFDVVPASELLVDPAVTEHTSPEALRDALVAGLLLEDPTVVEPLWPPDSWADWGEALIGEFVPRAADSDCERTGDTVARCFVFAQDMPFVLSLTMQQQVDGTWQVSTVAYDSTN